jgi:glutathione S-transferase
LHCTRSKWISKAGGFRSRSGNSTRRNLALNPEGKVPTLLVDGRPLTEVAAILYYLAKHFPEARLLPENDLEGEAQIISWMSFIASTIHPPPNRRRAVVLGIAEQRLGRREWAVGGYSIADIHLFRLFWRFFNSLHPAPADFPGLSAHYDRMIARPAVQRVLDNDLGDLALAFHFVVL